MAGEISTTQEDYELQVETGYGRSAVASQLARDDAGSNYRKVMTLLRPGDG